MKFDTGDRVVISPQAQFGRGKPENTTRFNQARDERIIGVVTRIRTAGTWTHIFARFSGEEWVFFGEDELDKAE